MYDAGPLLRHHLLFFILPLWMLAGFIDYVLHRRTRIEETTGTKESLFHATQLAEAGIPVLLALLLDINALIMLLMLIGFVLHEMTAVHDVTYAGATSSLRGRALALPVGRPVAADEGKRERYVATIAGP